jgi:hypothetical protein
MGGDDRAKSARFAKVLTNDDYQTFTVNNIFNWYGNNGDGSYNYFITNAGMEFPRGGGKSVVYEDGIVWGGYHKASLRPKVGGSMYRHGIQAGRILSPGGPTEAEMPVADDPVKPEYRVYRVRRDVGPGTPFVDVQASLESEAALISRFDSGATAAALYNAYVRDWNEWPARRESDQAGLAPFTDVDGNGLYNSQTDIPGYPESDQTLYYVGNDLNPTLTYNLLGSPPIGLEMHRTIWGYHRTGPPGTPEAFNNAIFSSTILINKSGAAIDSMVVAQWVDPDVGDASDDFVGCDTMRQLGYAYNGKASDATYGSVVPAPGYVLLQGPIVPSAGDHALFRGQLRQGYSNLKMTSFVPYDMRFDRFPPPDWQDRLMYRLLTGHTTDGGAFINPLDGQPSKFVFNGEPELSRGWRDEFGEGFFWDRRFLLSSGPFTMASEDTQEIVIATIIAQGLNNLSSIELLKLWADQVSYAFRNVPVSVPHVGEPMGFALMQNFPNPFNPATTIQYALPQRSHVTLEVFNVLGQPVATLVNGEVEAGEHAVQFDAAGLASGVYFCRMQARGFTQTRAMCLVR